MRRPLLIIFILVISTAFLYTNNIPLDTSYDNDTVIVQGVVKDKTESEKYDQYKVSKFLIRDYSKDKKLKVGKEVRLTGKFKNLDKMKYEEFDYGRYIKSLGYEGIIYIKEYSVIGEDILYTYIDKTKKYIRDTLRYLYKYNSDFINSLLIGEKYNLSKDEKEMFNKTGTSHIIAISGLHTGVLCASIAIVIKGINKIYKLIILFIIMSLYCIMVGVSPSIIRSIAFLLILYMAVFLDKKRDGISTLSLIGIFLIINNPYVIYNLSFQLSFLSTLSIMYFYGYINNVIKMSFISLSIAANILIIPIIYYSFKGIPMIFVISNMIIVPFIGTIMYLSIISIFLFNINIWIAKVIAYFNRAIINSIYFLLEILSRLDFAYITIDNPKKHYVIIYYIVVFSYMIYKELKVMKEQENELQGYYKEY